MRLINQSKNTVLAEDVSFADTAAKRVKGLLGRKDLPKGQALVIRPCNSIHTLFMRFPIDALFVDRDYKVIATLSGLKPFRVSRLYLRSRAVIELACGTIASSLTSKGDSLQILE